MAQSLRAHLPLKRAQSRFSSTHVGWLTTAHNSDGGDLKPLDSEYLHLYACSYRHTHIIKIKKILRVSKPIQNAQQSSDRKEKETTRTHHCLYFSLKTL